MELTASAVRPPTVFTTEVWPFEVLKNRAGSIRGSASLQETVRVSDGLLGCRDIDPETGRVMKKWITY
jgi:hypothetical protein